MYMQVYLPAIEGHVPSEMIQALRALIDFIYIARRDIIDSNSLKELDDTLKHFHQYRQIFQESGVRPKGFNLPQQHSLVHYYKLIRAFGAPGYVLPSLNPNTSKPSRNHGDVQIVSMHLVRCS